MIDVSLTWYECRLAASVGLDRYVMAMRDGRQDAHGFVGDEVEGLKLHVNGACGELAYAKATGLYWPATVDCFKTPDLGSNLQVRVRSSEKYDLIVRCSDDDEHVFAMVTGLMPRFKVWGELIGSEAKQERWKHAYGGRPQAYFVPKEFLKEPGFYRGAK